MKIRVSTFDFHGFNDFFYYLSFAEYKIPMIENLGATLDQFDTINFTNNEIRKIDNFPLLPRLKSLLFNNNRIV